MDQDKIVNAVAYAVRAAGSVQRAGGSRRWVRERFLPELERAGLTIAPSNSAVNVVQTTPAIKWDVETIPVDARQVDAV